MPRCWQCSVWPGSCSRWSRWWSSPSCCARRGPCRSSCLSLRRTLLPRCPRSPRRGSGLSKASTPPCCAVPRPTPQWCAARPTPTPRACAGPSRTRCRVDPPPKPRMHRQQCRGSRVAGLTAADAKAELVKRHREPGQARGGAHRPRHRGGGEGRRRDPRPQDRHPGHPAGRERADRRVGRQRPAPAERRHEGPHHRPRGPQHPRLRGGDRRQPDHRRHPGGRAALLLRPGAPRGRPAHAGEAGPRRPDPPAPHRGDARAQQGRGRAAVRASGRARTPWSSSASPRCTPS